MSRYLLAAIAIAMLASCEKEPEQPQAEGQEKVSVNFIVSKIEYLLDGKSGVDDAVLWRETFTFRNNSSVEQSYTFRPEDLVSESSQFRSNDPRAFELTDKVQKVMIPMDIHDSGTIVCDDGARWNYTEGHQTLKPLPRGSVDIPVKPHHEMKLASSFTFREISTKYRLHLKGVEFGEEISIEGSWSGSFLQNHDFEITMTELK